MPKKPATTEFIENQFADVDINTQMDIIAEGLSNYCDKLEHAGIDPMLLTGVMLGVYCDRMADLGDRSIYEEQLEAALEDEWDEHSIH